MAKLRDASPGAKAELNVIRGGKRQSLTIRLAARPDDPSANKFKYSEPEVAFSTTQLRGKHLTLGPDGQWQVEDLGSMQGLPEALAELKALQLDQMGQWMPKMFMSPHNFDFKFDLDNLPDAARFKFFSHLDGDAADDKSQISISLNTDGESLSIQRDENGQYTVNKSDADGKESSATYESAELFRENDPDAYQKFRQMTGRGHVGVFRMKAADDADLPAEQQAFQDRVEKILQEARAKVDEAKNLADQARKQAGKSGKGGPK